MSRNNRHITDLKWNTKKRLSSFRDKAEQMSVQWGDVNLFIAQKLEDIIGTIDEIAEEVNGVDAKSH